MNKKEGAIFSELTYEMLNKKNQQSSIDSINSSLQERGLNDWEAKREFSNKDIVTYYNDKDKRVVISHRGTDVTGKKTRSDIGADFLLGLGMEGHSKRFNARKNKTESIVKAMPDDYDLYLSGHSYGGGSVGYALEHSKPIRERTIKARLYNGAVSPLHLQKGISKNTKKQLDNIVTHHRTRNDIVSKPHTERLRYGKLKNQDTSLSSITKFIPKKVSKVFDTLEAYHAHKLDHFM